jgi:hypothetical protein
MTAIAKLLVLLNAFVAVAICSWAIATYINRTDPAEAADLAGEKLNAKVKRQNDEVKLAQQSYPGRLGDIDAAETDLAQVKFKIKQRLDQALTGTFVRNPIPMGKIDLIDKPDPALSPPILGLDGKPLQGRKKLEKELDESVRRASDASKEIEGYAKEQSEIGPKINVQDARAARLKFILLAHFNEIEYLGDEKVNWENRTVSLVRRRNQLQTRLADLEAAVKTSALVAPENNK